LSELVKVTINELPEPKPKKKKQRKKWNPEPVLIAIINIP
jgi:hypothetical protein